MPTSVTSNPGRQISSGIPFPAAAAYNIKNKFHASRVYVICSGTLARTSHCLEQLTSALEVENVQVVGKRIGMTSHTMWSEVIEVVKDVRRVRADLLLTLGAGSLTDAAKVVTLVCSIELTFFFFFFFFG